MESKTNVIIRLECSGEEPLKDFLDIINGKADVHTNITPAFQLTEGYIIGKKERKHGHKRHFIELKGTVTGTSVLSWFKVPIDEIRQLPILGKDKIDSLDNGFFLRLIEDYCFWKWRIFCKSKSADKHDDHEIILKSKSDEPWKSDYSDYESKVTLIVDKKEVKDNGFFVDLGDGKYLNGVKIGG